MAGEDDAGPRSKAKSDYDRDRFFFDLDPDLVPIVEEKTKGYGGKRRYFNAAVRAFEFPAYRLGTSESVDVAARSLAAFVEPAREEIAFVGTTIPITLPPCDELLRSKVTAGIRLSLLTLDPELPHDDPVYLLLHRQLGDEAFVHARQLHVQTLVELFEQLRTLGLQHGTRVRILGCRELPMCGLAIVDHGTTEAKMRLSLYDSLSTTARSPYFDVNPAMMEGNQAYQRLYHYYESLVTRSTDLAARKGRQSSRTAH